MHSIPAELAAVNSPRYPTRGPSAPLLQQPQEALQSSHVAKTVTLPTAWYCAKAPLRPYRTAGLTSGQDCAVAGPWAEVGGSAGTLVGVHSRAVLPLRSYRRIFRHSCSSNSEVRPSCSVARTCFRRRMTGRNAPERSASPHGRGSLTSPPCLIFKLVHDLAGFPAPQKHQTSTRGPPITLRVGIRSADAFNIYAVSAVCPRASWVCVLSNSRGIAHLTSILVSPRPKASRSSAVLPSPV